MNDAFLNFIQNSMTVNELCQLEETVIHHHAPSQAKSHILAKQSY